MSDDKPIKAHHQFKNGNGRTREYTRRTVYPCDVCNPDGVYPDRFFCEFLRLSDAVLCECENCGHERTVALHRYEIDHA